MVFFHLIISLTQCGEKLQTACAASVNIIHLTFKGYLISNTQPVGFGCTLRKAIILTSHIKFATFFFVLSTFTGVGVFLCVGGVGGQLLCVKNLSQA